MTDRPRSHQAVSVAQAANAAPTLAALRQRIQASQRCLGLVLHLMPENLRQRVKAGPIADTEWCLLVDGAAASSKLRQMLPALLQELTRNGEQVSAIRLKVQTLAR